MYLPEDNTLPFEAGNVAPPLHGPPSNSDDPEDKQKRKRCAAHIDVNLLMCKAFYFLFYGAYGSLYPLLAVYFKQLGLNASQSGLLIGIRPFIEFCAAPLWGGLADSWRKAKVLFLFSLFAWLIFTEAMAFIRPASSICITVNRTGDDSHIIFVSQVSRDGGVHTYMDLEKPGEGNENGLVVGYQSDIDQPFDNSAEVKGYHLINSTRNGEEPVHRSSPTTIKFVSDDVRGVFLLLLIIIVVGEFFSSPTITLADSATLGYLGSNRLEYYGQQRMFGSLGWGVFMLIEGILLDQTRTSSHGCGVNYYICFGTYAVLITCSFFVAMQFKFKYHSDDDHNTEMSKLTYNKKEGQVTIGGDGEGPMSYGAVTESPHTSGEGVHESVAAGSVPGACGTSQDPGPGSQSLPAEDPAGIKQVFRMFATIRYGSVLCVAWFAGFGMGLLFTFLYWHLQDLGGPPSLFGLASVVNHVSEILAYFFSHKILQAIGHIPVFCVGLFCYSIRFLAISILDNPWWVLIVETLQGLTHALIWAACTSYIGLATSQRLRSSAQGILQGTHHGLGRGCGAIFGGLLVNAFGTRETFRGFGVASLVVLVIFLAMQYPTYSEMKSASTTNPPPSKPSDVQPVLTSADLSPIPYSDQQRELHQDVEKGPCEPGSDEHTPPQDLPTSQTDAEKSEAN
ncbi:major facilitator superfamily domain-containing protein 6-like [Diadema setosum]|uniref:major facilitator superfamily domain-containing protein 6-like n=1 Tax=Diadema setosum TaxID=31175 RepID=UPI003B3AB2C6